jgi:hypothetical protein
MTGGEKKLATALVLMVNQYLDEYGYEVDSRSMSAGEHAIEALADFGLMEVVNTRFGRWTEAGKQFRRHEVGIRDPAQVDHAVGVVLVGKPDPKEFDGRFRVWPRRLYGTGTTKGPSINN